jgi:hypothetical protein
MSGSSTAVGVEALLALVSSRVLDLKVESAEGAAHAVACDYEWDLRISEWGVRFEGVLVELHESPAEAVADALNFRDEVLACELREVYRCEVMAVRVEDMDSHETLGWRGRVDLGLQSRAA